jgi:hypothetical protein
MRMRVFGSSRVLGLGQAVVFALAVLVAALLPASASAAPSFASEDAATVFPSVSTVTEGAGTCTSNFVFTNGTDVFLGQVAHCASTGQATELNGCTTGSLPLGTPVKVGDNQRGTLAYSSWLAMQEVRERDTNACMFNDFALVKLDPADVASTNPSVPGFGGPTGIDIDGTQMGDRVYSVGNSPIGAGLLGGQKTGSSLGTFGGGWTHAVQTFPLGVPGDSGSGYLTDGGSALGVLSTLTLLSPDAPPGSNGVSDLRLALDYANEHGGLGTLELVPGTESFDPNGGGVGLGSLGDDLGILGLLSS